MPYACKSLDDVLSTIKEDKIEMVDLRFTDLPGCGSTFRCRQGRSILRPSPKASASTALRFGDFKKSRKATCWSSPTQARHFWIRSLRRGH